MAIARVALAEFVPAVLQLMGGAEAIAEASSFATEGGVAAATLDAMPVKSCTIFVSDGIVVNEAAVSAFVTLVSAFVPAVAAAMEELVESVVGVSAHSLEPGNNSSAKTKKTAHREARVERVQPRNDNLSPTEIIGIGKWPGSPARASVRAAQKACPPVQTPLPPDDPDYWSRSCPV